MVQLPPKTIQRIRLPLARWYRKCRRDLPWRGSKDPYAIWVSEIMLQQTRVATVGPYYRRFLRRFPSVKALAREPLGDVLKAWEGLGYYSRARNLHKAARQVMEEFGGRIPRTAEELVRLAGIGRYTAGAIASIAFGRDEPVLDGNVIRVLCRALGIAADPARSAVRRRLWSIARQLVPHGQAGEFNQAVMDLGATVCTPRRPLCPACPLQATCRAFVLGRQADLPRRRRKRPLPHYDVAVGVIWKSGRILIDQRPAEGLLGGLWEFPGGKIHKGESQQSALRREVREELGIRIDVLEPLIEVAHAYSHFRVTLHVWTCRWRSGRPVARRCAAFRWARQGDLRRYAFPLRGNQRIIAALLA